MQSLALLLCVFCFLTAVSCSKAAGSYQSVYVYYAYRMDIAAHGVGATGIATACRGSISDGSCTFDELMKHIHGRDPAWSGDTDIGKNLFPDPVDAAKQLDKLGYDNVWKHASLLPHMEIPADQSPSLARVFGAITDRIQDARQTLGDGRVGRELASAKLMMTCIKEARLLEQAKGRIDAINKELTRRGVTWEVDTREVVGVTRPWTEFDAFQTLANHEDAKPKIILLVQDFDNWWFKQKGLLGKSHHGAIMACQAAADRLFASCD